MSPKKKGVARKKRPATAPYVVVTCDDCGEHFDGDRAAWARGRRHAIEAGHDVRVAVERIYRYSGKSVSPKKQVTRRRGVRRLCQAEVYESGEVTGRQCYNLSMRKVRGLWRCHVHGGRKS